MNVRAIAAVAGTVLALGMGSAFADVHDTLAPPGNPTPTTSQSVSGGADLQLPGAGSVTSGSAVYDYQCADARANAAPGSFDIATYCGPGAR
jgi:hypothetical protein